MLPAASMAMPSPIAPSGEFGVMWGGIEIGTFPSFTLPIRIPLCQPGEPFRSTHSPLEDMLLRHSLASLSLNRDSADFDTTKIASMSLCQNPFGINGTSTLKERPLPPAHCYAKSSSFWIGAPQLIGLSKSGT
jgi:hypothetical protein